INASLFENVVTLSHHDPLTGAYNRTKLEELLKKWEKASAVYAEKKISVFLLDLNNFKAVNDNYGHRAGDQLLKKTTRLITSSARKRDLFFRIGGDEFLYLAFHDDASSIKEAE
ncbi:GGDEF domain-containing protein, partial [Coxiella burnetii]